MRIGQGFDVHSFTTGNFVTLAGVNIPHSKAMLAHSDGDVALHSLCDALLGALALGDIGQHFPPSDIQWRNVSSRLFLQQCYQLILSKNYVISNADITIICELPKILPYVLPMRKIIATDLNCNIEQISIKATTTEQLGFTGRREGIAAQSIVLLKPL